MIHDAQYQDLPRPRGGLDHEYGPNVSLLSFPYPMSLLTELCAEDTKQPRINQLVCMLFDWMLGEIASRELTTRAVTVTSRMRLYDKEGVYAGEGVDRHQRAVIVALARAGLLPAQRFFDGLNQLLDPDGVRQDHIFMNRKTNEAGEVTGVDISGSKIGGPVGDATVIIPDPMGATGGSMVEALRRYRDEIPGTARRLIAVHMIVTPEYLRRVTAEIPEAQIYAIRLDRGLSPADVLQLRPGAAWDKERGLNNKQYIVPGGGGFGELINNAWI